MRERQGRQDSPQPLLAMSWLWLFLGALVVLAGLRYRWRLRSSRRPRRATPTIDDAALRQILEEGRLSADSDDDPLDMDAAAEAEDDFWAESWDEPEEHRP
jgi:hypothetical protein